MSCFYINNMFVCLFVCFFKPQTQLIRGIKIVYNMIFSLILVRNLNTMLLSYRYQSEDHGTFKQCDDGRCCCFIKMSIIYGEKLAATVYKGGESIGTKVIDVKRGCKFPFKCQVHKSAGNIKKNWAHTLFGHR